MRAAGHGPGAGGVHDAVHGAHRGLPPLPRPVPALPCPLPQQHGIWYPACLRRNMLSNLL